MIEFFLKNKRSSFIIYSIGISIILAYLLSSLSQTFSNQQIHSEIVENYSNTRYFINGVLIAPFIESLVFQTFIIEYIKKVFGDKYLIHSILVSGIVFGLLHYLNNYNLAYAFTAIIMGFIFASVYVIAIKRADINPFLITLICHFSVNFIAFLYRIYPILSKFI